jgi:hypothetical protein
MTNIITNWDSIPQGTFGQEPMRLSHGLHQHALFTDDALARLIERSERQNYYVNTMNIDAHDTRSRREGEISGIGGQDVLDAIRKGKLWILLLSPEKAEPGYKDLVDQIYDEIGQNVPGFKPLTQKMSLLISSPGIQVYYHCDVPGQTLWQVRGQKKVYVYPNRPPYLPQANLEKIVLNEAHEISLPYDVSYENEAVVYDLMPGEMLHWPLNCPHRIVNQDSVNVSFTTEHFTPAIRRSFIVNYANGVLRRQGLANLSQNTEGLGYWTKLGVAGAYKYSGLAKKRRQVFKIDFQVDPSAPRGVRDIPAYEFQK